MIFFGFFKILKIPLDFEARIILGILQESCLHSTLVINSVTFAGGPLASVAGRGVGRDAAGKSVEDAALVTTTWSQGSAANSAAPLTRSRSGSRPGVAAPVADEQ